ncbi:MAG TPA: D-alanine--D-alanine ligase [Candidatus Woesebacteria bacterium]|nr:D-alanine--D-alanine ligase [Candidatus Shapirobacteria bacterium]HOR02112.1 D-alanine--D-alanine ligase [Candidatus Woesebacteria bacterium]
MRKTRVLVLMGGGGSEHKVSLSSGKEVVKNFDKNKYEVVEMVVENKKVDIEGIKKVEPDVVFIAIHGGVGEDGTIQRILENEGIKFVGCGSRASELGIDKIKFKKLMRENNLPVPNGLEVAKDEMVDLDEVRNLRNKWVVKPATQGSSVGVTIVTDLDKLDRALEKAFEYDDWALIEEFIEGMEVSCGVLGNEKPMVLPVIEIRPKNEFFDYEAKYIQGKCDEIVPARLTEVVTKKVQEYTLKVFEVIGGRGFARVDFVIKDNLEPKILEINTIPGLTPTSLLPKEAAAVGISYTELLDRMVELAIVSL